MKTLANARIFVVSAPSGCGKTTLCRKLLAGRLGLAGSVSVTTRPPRPGEKDGADYRFVSDAEFRRMAASGEFLEYESNFGASYGTPIAPVRQALSAGRSVLLSIDVKGAMKVRAAFPRASVLIFILPPSIPALRKRLEKRMSDSGEAIARRLALAEKEMACREKYDHRVINDDLDTAYHALRKIIQTELGRREAARRRPRRPNGGCHAGSRRRSADQ